MLHFSEFIPTVHVLLCAKTHLHVYFIRALRHFCLLSDFGFPGFLLHLYPPYNTARQPSVQFSRNSPAGLKPFDPIIHFWLLHISQARLWLAGC